MAKAAKHTAGTKKADTLSPKACHSAVAGVTNPTILEEYHSRLHLCIVYTWLYLPAVLMCG